MKEESERKQRKGKEPHAAGVSTGSRTTQKAAVFRELTTWQERAIYY